MTEIPKYPNIEVELLGRDGNAFFILGAVRKALRRAGISEDEVFAFTTEATGRDYDELLTTTMRWVEVV